MLINLPCQLPGASPLDAFVSLAVSAPLVVTAMSRFVAYSIPRSSRTIFEMRTVASGTSRCLCRVYRARGSVTTASIGAGLAYDVVHGCSILGLPHCKT